MRMKVTLASVALAAAAFCFAPQSANAAPPLGDTKQVTKSNAEQVGYRRGHRGWRHRHYNRHRHYHGPRRYYGNRHYYRRPGFGVYLGF